MKTTITTELAQRIEKALHDFTNGRACMHVPPFDTDVDIVLADCLTELEAKDKQIAELERDTTKLIEERDNAEESLADMFEAATGERPEWSSAFGYDDAVDVVGEKTEEWKDRVHTIDMSNSVLQSQLEAKTLSLEVSCDRNYVAGLQAGWNFGDAGDNDGLAQCIESRQKYIRESRTAGSVALEARTEQQPIPISETNDQIAAVMMRVGTGQQKSQAVAYAHGLPPAPAPVTVKLPNFSDFDSYSTAIEVLNAVREELTAAGIKIAEGE